jgi:hypothetical protein
MTAAGILSSSLTVAGLITPYVELAKRQGQVVGISRSFKQIELPSLILSRLPVSGH